MKDKPLKHFFESGIKVIPTYTNGKTQGSWKDLSNFTNSLGDMQDHWKSGFRKFQFMPCTHGLVVFDIDRKNNKDGIQELLELFNDKGLAMPDYLLDVKQHPAYTKTPSNGFHLYFRYSGNKKFKSCAITPGFEVVHYNHLVTAPGSQKDDKPYLFYGDINKAPALPYVLESMLEEWGAEPEKQTTWTYKQKDYGDMPLFKIKEVIDKQGQYSPGDSRNQYAYAIACFARKKGHSTTDVESFLCGCLSAPDFTASEIKHTVKSAFKR